MSSEEAYAEALRRICEAENTGATDLDLSGLQFLRQLPRELKRLEFLQTLNLAWGGQLSDLSPLAGLTSLQTLNLAWGGQLSDLSPLAGLTSLQTLNLSGCEQLSDLSPLAGLTSLQTLNLSGCGQLSDLNPLAGLTSRLPEGPCSSFLDMRRRSRRSAPLPPVYADHVCTCLPSSNPARGSAQFYRLQDFEGARLARNERLASPSE